jgi:hypothetical protein
MRLFRVNAAAQCCRTSLHSLCDSLAVWVVNLNVNGSIACRVNTKFTAVTSWYSSNVRYPVPFTPFIGCASSRYCSIAALPLLVSSLRPPTPGRAPQAAYHASPQQPSDGQLDQLCASSRILPLSRTRFFGASMTPQALPVQPQPSLVSKSR